MNFFSASQADVFSDFLSLGLALTALFYVMRFLKKIQNGQTQTLKEQGNVVESTLLDLARKRGRIDDSVTAEKEAEKHVDSL